MKISHILLCFGILVPSPCMGFLGLENLLFPNKQDMILQLPSVVNMVLKNPLIQGLSGDKQADMMISLLQNLTEVAQKPIMNVLQSLGIGLQVKTYWMNNKIEIKGLSLPLLNTLKLVPGILDIREPVQVSAEDSATEAFPHYFTERQTDNIQWGVSRVHAPDVWKITKGEGIILGGIDSGVFGGHEALKGNYGGFWFDAVQGKKEPYDDNGHGTHTVGTMVGQTNGIGIAPEAKWIACKALDKNKRGDERALTTCAQELAKARPLPHIINNSWGAGGKGTWFDDEIKVWHTLGIIPVFSNGNSGRSGCKSAMYPAISKDVIAVGNTDSKDQPNLTSSRGPSLVGGLMKPDLAAPGTMILSAFPNGKYHSDNGTSMAGPHVAAGIALLMSIDENLTFKEVFQLLKDTADKPKNTLSAKDLKCGVADKESGYPNNVLGHGIINLDAAVKALTGNKEK